MGLGVVQSVASMEIESARDRFEFLKKQSIPAELRVAKDGSGLEIGEVVVDDESMITLVILLRHGMRSDTQQKAD